MSSRATSGINNNSSDECESIEFLVNIAADAKYGLGLRLGMKRKGEETCCDKSMIVVESFKRNPVNNEMLPGEALGVIRIGDEILSVNNERLNGYTIDAALSIIRDVVVHSRGSPVVFHIRRYVLKNISTTRIGSLRLQDVEDTSTVSIDNMMPNLCETKEELEYFNKMHNLIYESAELSVGEIMMHNQYQTYQSMLNKSMGIKTKDKIDAMAEGKESRVLHYFFSSATSTECNKKESQRHACGSHNIQHFTGVAVGSQMECAKSKVGDDGNSFNNNGCLTQVPDWHAPYLINLILNPTTRDLWHKCKTTSSVPPTISPSVQFDRVIRLLSVLLSNLEEANSSDRHYSIHDSHTARLILQLNPLESADEGSGNALGKIRKLTGFFTDFMNYCLHSSYTNTVQCSDGDHFGNSANPSSFPPSSATSMLPMSLTSMPCGALYNIDDIAVFACISKRMLMHLVENNSALSNQGISSVESAHMDEWGTKCMALMLCVDIVNSYRISPDDSDVCLQPRTVLPAASIACAMLANKASQLTIFNELVTNSFLSVDEQPTGGGLYFGELWKGRMEAGVSKASELDILGIINDSRLALWMHDLTPVYKLIETQSIKQFRVHRDSLKVS